MTRLVLLNGPPGIGKSTVAARYADDHPGTLNLDIDTLHVLVGGWRQLGGRVHDLLRPLALAMAAEHLSGGRDVIVPQFVADPVQARRFERVAADGHAQFREVVLMTDRADALARFDARPDDGQWARHNRQIVAGMGGAVALGAMHEQLLNYVSERSEAVRVPSRAGDVDGTYRDVEGAIEGVPRE